MGPQTDVPGKEGICHIQCDHKKFTVQTSIILRVLIIRASLIAQLVKNLPVMQETLVQFLGGKISWRRDRLPTPVFLGFPGGLPGKESACSAGDLHSVLGLGRSPGEENGYPLQYSSLENPTDCIVHGVAKSRPQLSDFHFHFPSLACLCT